MKEYEKQASLYLLCQSTNYCGKAVGDLVEMLGAEIKGTLTLEYSTAGTSRKHLSRIAYGCILLPLYPQIGIPRSHDCNRVAAGC